MHKPHTFGKSLAAALLLLIAGGVGLAGEEEAIKKAIRAETEAYFKGDAAAWEATWWHDETAARTLVSNGSYASSTGWTNFGPATIQMFKERKALSAEIRSDNYIIQTGDNLAWVAYDQHVTAPGTDPKRVYFSRESRVMVRKNGEWKISTQMTHFPDSFNGPLEGSINSTGYGLIASKKYKSLFKNCAKIICNVNLYCFARTSTSWGCVIHMT